MTTASLSHNPRILSSPAAPVCDEVERYTAHDVPLGEWFIKLLDVPDPDVSRLGSLLVDNGGGFEVERQAAGRADIVLCLPEAFRDRFTARLLENASPSVGKAITSTLDAYQRTTFRLDCRGAALEVGKRTLIMGIVNVTPDSFSDGGEFLDPEAAVAHAERLAEEGADILDIGGESTRPGAQPVSVNTELERVIPVIEALASHVNVPISIDTSKARVAERALEAGASIINDVTALRGDPAMRAVAAHSGVPVVLMHMKGTPRTMQRNPTYADLMGEIVGHLRASMTMAVRAGVSEEQIIVDPGIGFGKTLDHNLEIMRRLGELRSLGRPILLGTSRKSMIGAILDVPPPQRLFGTAATLAFGIQRGAHILRVHDVRPAVHVARMTDAMLPRTPHDPTP